MAARGKARAAAELEADPLVADPPATDPLAADPLATMGRPGPVTVSASLADQPGAPGPGGAGPGPAGVAIALGANLGDPLATLLAVRPLLVGLAQRCLDPAPGRLCWSPLFRTEPVGGPPGQPPYLNAVLLVEPAVPLAPNPAAALALLADLLALERRFGRRRLEHWGPRTLDLDLLWWGSLQLQTPTLTLPHPRLAQRSFVLAPLAAMDPALVLPGPALVPDSTASAPAPPHGPDPGPSCGALLAALLPRLPEAPPQRLPGRPGWPE